MKYLIATITVLLSAPNAFGQIRSNPEQIIQRSDPHFAVLAAHQDQIKGQYDKGKWVIPSFGRWFRVQSEETDQLFAKLAFYSISWSESPHPDSEEKALSLAIGLTKTVSINIDTGNIESELFCNGNYEAFGELLIKHKVALQDHADADRIWKAFCELHHKSWHTLPMKKVSDTNWHLGISSYDQTVSATEGFETVVTRTHYMQVIADDESRRIIFWGSRMHTSNKRTVSKD